LQVEHFLVFSDDFFDHFAQRVVALGQLEVVPRRLLPQPLQLFNTHGRRG
jgi:hypothetical protein